MATCVSCSWLMGPVHIGPAWGATVHQHVHSSAKCSACMSSLPRSPEFQAFCAVLPTVSLNCRVEAMAWGDPSLLQSAQRGNVVQLQRKGFYIVDQVCNRVCGPSLQILDFIEVTCKYSWPREAYYKPLRQQAATGAPDPLIYICVLHCRSLGLETFTIIRTVSSNSVMFFTYLCLLAPWCVPGSSGCGMISHVCRCCSSTGSQEAAQLQRQAQQMQQQEQPLDRWPHYVPVL